MKPSHSSFRAGISLLAVLFHLSCGDSSGTGPPEPEAPAPATMAVAPEQITVDALGETVQYSATVWDQLGRVLSDAALTWYTSDEKVALINESGLATAVGDGTATILASASPSVFGWGEIVVTAKPPAITTSLLPPGVVGLPYSQTLDGEGVTPSTWSIVGGALPHGLVLDSDTGEISGMPTTVGKSSFTVMLSGLGNSVTKTFSLTIASGKFGIDFDEDQFALVPAGSFQMGSTNGQPDEQPVHPVNITQPFLMLKTEITQHQWKSVMENNPAAFVNCGEVCPVENLTFDQIQDFLYKLNSADPGKSYRLPTEAEWEYAARAGTTGDYGGTGVLDEMGWHLGNAGAYTQFVAQKLPNDWGLFDMHGNVSEWVGDWYSGTYYAVSPTNDPPGPATGTGRVTRGGSVAQDPVWARSAERAWGNVTPPWNKHSTRGFRIVRNP